MVYLAGAIDLVDGNNRTTWRDKITKVLNEHNLAVYNPVGAFGAILTDTQVAENIVEINTFALKQCQHIVFVMGKKYPSVGTPIELYLAHELDLGFTVIWDPTPAMDEGFEEYGDGDTLPIYVRHFSKGKKIFNGFGGAIAHVIKETKTAARMPAPPFDLGPIVPTEWGTQVQTLEPRKSRI